jgi:hypothetical protein
LVNFPLDANTFGSHLRSLNQDSLLYHPFLRFDTLFFASIQCNQLLSHILA